MNDAARRVLSERTGLSDIYLDQFYTFGDLARYDQAPLRTIMQAKGMNPTDDHWLLRRFVSVGYYALIDFNKAAPTPDTLVGYLHLVHPGKFTRADARPQCNCAESIADAQSRS